MTETIHAIEHIVSSPGVLGGKRRITGTRIAVAHIVSAAKAEWSPDRIASEYNLTLAQVHAALAYYHDHRDEIEQEFQEDDAYVTKLKDERGNAGKHAQTDQE